MKTDNKIRCISFFLISLAAVLRGQNAWPDAGSVAEAMSRANNYWSANNSLGDSGWARSAYYTGNQRAARVLANRSYVNRAFAWAAANSWQIGPEGPNSADAFCCGQTYIDLYRLNPQPVGLADISSRVNAWIASSATNQLFWIDAFYMAGPTFARMASLTGNTNYLQKLWQMYSYMKDGIHLFDPSASLWYRDATFIYPAATNAHGGKVFWSRGNGWVFAGLARVLQQMQPSSPHYQDYAAMFQAMAPALKAVQGADGMWRTSLADAAQYPNPETSGTGFFTYGFAWGIRSGLLPMSGYSNTVVRAWNGLTNLALNAQGFVGYVQPPASAPGPDSATHNEDFGVGAFLLACSEIELLATNGPAAGPWAGVDQTLNNTNPSAPLAFTLDGSQTEVYRALAGNFTWWENGSQIASGTNAQISLSPGQHVITLKVPGANGITSTDSVTVTVVAPTPPGLKLQFDFEDAGTTTTDSLAGASLRLVNASGAPVDLHGIPGSGVGGYGKALTFTGASMGGSGPMAFTTNNSAVSFGTINAFTATLWIRPASSLLINFYPRFFTLGANGLADRGVANSLQLLSNGSGQAGTAVQGFINTLQTSTATFGAFDMPANQWSFLALTYDGATLNFYGGSESNPLSLRSSAAFAAGPVTLNNAWTLMLGNRLALDRAFAGQMDAVRFYDVALPVSGLENVRAAAVALPAISARKSGTNFILTLRTRTNALYILQSTTNLAAPAWTPLSTNTGLGAVISISIPINLAAPRQFFRYQIR
jgi:unsaturated rhamnogalacturonyl hydrolase